MKAIAVETARERMLQHAPILPETVCPLSDALGRVLSRDMLAPVAQPPFDRSPLDGYALRAADTQSAPVRLRVVDTVYAGDVPARTVQAGEAVRVMTGAMLPAGADCVIRQEDVEREQGSISFHKKLSPRENFIACGSEYVQGDLLLRRGTRLDPAALAVAAGAGLTELPVCRTPRAAILSTGDELSPPGQPLAPGHIYDSNRVYLTARLRQLGVCTAASGRAGDDPSRLTDALDGYARDSGIDLILTTGGVSVGEKDLLEQTLRTLGGEVVFHGLAMKPGMPTLFAVLCGTPVLGLSGNPFSAAVPLELLLPPMLARMTGEPALCPRTEQAIAANGFDKASPTRRFLRGYCRAGRVSIPDRQANGQMRNMVGCNCLIDLPAGTGAVSPGDAVAVHWLA